MYLPMLMMFPQCVGGVMGRVSVDAFPVVVLSNLVKGGRYTVWVHAINAVGPGPSLSVSFTQKR